MGDSESNLQFFWAQTKKLNEEDAPDFEMEEIPVVATGDRITSILPRDWNVRDRAPSTRKREHI
jgi:hypothetical protein